MKTVTSHHYFAQLIAIVVGAFTVAQSRANGELAHLIASGVQAAIISFGTGLLLLILLVLLSSNIRKGFFAIFTAVKEQRLKKWQVFGGMVGAFFVTIQSISVPLVGVAVFTVLIVGGQTLSSLLVDKWGVSPSGVAPVTSRRVFAALFAVVGVVIAVADRFGDAQFAVAPLVASFLIGAAVSFQHAINGHVGVASGNPVSAAVMNFIMGMGLLLLIFTVQVISGHTQWTTPPSSPWWIYLGGSIGVAFIASATWAIRKLGALRFVMGSVAGQLLGSLLIDLFAPTDGTKVSLNLVAGLAITLVAVLLANRKAHVIAPAEVV
jgi:transporter family-2 protein